MIDLYREMIRLTESGEKAALATVVGSTGSTPGKEGAKMLVRADGSTVGTIGGGCTEADVWALAKEVIATDQPVRKSFKLSPKQAEDGGLACGGIVEVFIEPIGSPTVAIFGAGHIARSLVKLTNLVGFNTIVADDRQGFVARTHFPEPTRLVLSEFVDVFAKLKITESTYIVIVTRGHRHDQQVLSDALRTRAPYVGLIGSKAKIGRIFRTLVAQGADPKRLQAVRAPIGLDIGSRTAEEIAVSIAAELIAFRRRYALKGDRDSRLAGSSGTRLSLGESPRCDGAGFNGNVDAALAEASVDPIAPGPQAPNDP